MPIAGILRLAKRRRPPLTPRPAKIYGPFFLSSNSSVRAVSPGRDVVALACKKIEISLIYKKNCHILNMMYEPF
jgi:hypothetical protein